MKPVTIIINRQAIEQKDHVKYLGILIDSKLLFKQHITSLQRSFLEPLVYYTSLDAVSKKVLIMMYYILVYPFLIYALPVYGAADCIHLNNIHLLQKNLLD